MNNPVISIVMPLFNGRPYVADAIDSVLSQTFGDWELLVIDDGSTDDGLELVRTNYADTRIRLMVNPSNQGVAYTRGVGIEEAKGEFLAWLDCDDIILPERLELQLDYLRKNPDIGLCGTWIERFGGDDNSKSCPPSDPEMLRCMLLFTPIVPNATVMLRLDLVRKHGITYDNDLPIAEDYDFVLQCSRHFKVGIVPRVLYRYRVAENSLMQRYDAAEEKSFAVVKAVQRRALTRFGIETGDTELRLHRCFNSGLILANFTQYKDAFYWLLSLVRHNETTAYYDRKVFRRAAANRFFFLSKKASSFGLRTLTFYIREAITHNLLYYELFAFMKFVVRCFIRYDKF
jgi:glycosyltransferase involved in cell wall biosynthesis